MNQHEGAIAPPNNVRLALGRYKFTPDLDAKISNALSAQADYGGKVEYESLESALRHFKDLSLLEPESVEFEDVSSLESAGHVFLK